MHGEVGGKDTQDRTAKEEDKMGVPKGEDRGTHGGQECPRDEEPIGEDRDITKGRTGVPMGKDRDSKGKDCGAHGEGQGCPWQRTWIT